MQKRETIFTLTELQDNPFIGNLSFECSVDTCDKVDGYDYYERCITAFEDSEFRTICQESDKKRFIGYLIEHQILNLTNQYGKSNIKMGWFYTTTNIITYTQAALAVDVATAANFAAVTDVAAAVEVAAAVAAAVVGNPEKNKTCLSSEAFKICVNMAGKLGNSTFQNQIYNIFADLENGKEVSL